MIVVPKIGLWSAICRTIHPCLFYSTHRPDRCECQEVSDSFFYDRVSSGLPECSTSRTEKYHCLPGALPSGANDKWTGRLFAFLKSPAAHWHICKPHRPPANPIFQKSQITIPQLRNDRHKRNFDDIRNLNYN